MGEELDFNGKKYVSSKRLSQSTGYAHDYISRLCREGKIDGKLVGRNWFVDNDSLVSYKKNSRDDQRSKLLSQKTSSDNKNKTKKSEDEWEQVIFSTKKETNNVKKIVENPKLSLYKRPSYNYPKNIVSQDMSFKRNKPILSHIWNKNGRFKRVLFFSSLVIFFLILFFTFSSNSSSPEETRGFLYSIFEKKIVIENR